MEKKGNKADCGQCSMDKRCPRKLKKHPTSFCPMAVIRLKAIRNADSELTEAEEDRLPGCPWAINHQMSNYCFFKFIAEYIDQQPLSDMEIAHLNSLSKDTVKKTEKSALAKIRNVEEIKEIRDSHEDGPVVEDGTSDDDPYSII